MKLLLQWLTAFRLKTLTASLVPIITATALASKQGYTISWFYFSCLLVAALCIQIATNLFNDAIDFKKGADKNRTGPTRVTQSGYFRARTVFIMGTFFITVALFAGWPLVLLGGWPFFWIGITSLFLAYGYTGGPFPLAYLGLGDLFVLLYFGLIAVTGSYYILTLQWSFESCVLGLQVGLLSTVLIAINNLRDAPEDKRVGKKTLAVRFGETFVKWEIVFLILLSYLLLFYWQQIYQSLSFYLYLLSLPLAFVILRTIFFHKNKKELLPTLGQSALLHVLFGVTFLLACFL